MSTPEATWEIRALSVPAWPELAPLGLCGWPLCAPEGQRRVEIAECTTCSSSRGSSRKPSVVCTSLKCVTMKATHCSRSSCAWCLSAAVSTAHASSMLRPLSRREAQCSLSRSTPKRSAAAKRGSAISAATSVLSVYRWSSSATKTSAATPSIAIACAGA